MSGRIWVVEENMGTRTKPAWWATSFVRDTRELARKAQGTAKRALGRKAGNRGGLAVHLHHTARGVQHKNPVR